MPDFGRDYGTVDGLDFRLVSGPENLAQSLLRRLQTPQGALWWAPNYGLDVRQFMADGVTDGGYELSVLIEAELERDERVEACSVTIQGFEEFQEYQTHRIVLSIRVETIADGPYDLVVEASQAGVRMREVALNNAVI